MAWPKCCTEIKGFVFGPKKTFSQEEGAWKLAERTHVDGEWFRRCFVSRSVHLRSSIWPVYIFLCCDYKFKIGALGIFFQKIPSQDMGNFCRLYGKHWEMSTMINFTRELFRRCFVLRSVHLRPSLWPGSEHWGRLSGPLLGGPQ